MACWSVFIASVKPRYMPDPPHLFGHHSYHTSSFTFRPHQGTIFLGPQLKQSVGHSWSSLGSCSTPDPPDTFFTQLENAKAGFCPTPVTHATPAVVPPDDLSHKLLAPSTCFCAERRTPQASTDDLGWPIQSPLTVPPQIPAPGGHQRGDSQHTPT